MTKRTVYWPLDTDLLAQSLATGHEERVDVVVHIGPSVADWISVGLALGLVIVTVVYVIHTRSMVNEMARQRKDDVVNRRREKSDRAAYRCLAVIQDVIAQMTRLGPSAVEPETFLVAHEILLGEGAMIEDQEVRHRVGACSQVVYVGSFSREQIAKERLSAGRVALGAREVLRATRSMLQNYLAEQEPSHDMWLRTDVDGCGERLPALAEASAWIRCVGKSANGAHTK